MTSERWEVGSDFHLLELPWTASSPAPWGEHSHALFGAGRDPVIAIARAHAVRRLWVPSYFCQDVLASWQAAGARLQVYADAPTDDPSDQLALEPGDAVLATAYFGLRPPVRFEAEGVVVIEDHTHDPFARAAWESRADYCIASLRKTLPVPDGAVAWSPCGYPIEPPSPADERRTRALLDRLTSMALKARYLRGESVTKETFRTCAVRGEQALALGAPSRCSDFTAALLQEFPFDAWRRARAANHRAFVESFVANERAQVLGASTDASVPFSVLLRFSDRRTRDAVREWLVQRSIYPAILWTLDAPVVEGIPPAHVALSGELLSVPCDGRYTGQTMERVARIVNESLEATA